METIMNLLLTDFYNCDKLILRKVQMQEIRILAWYYLRYEWWKERLKSENASRNNLKLLLLYLIYHEI